ncbi:gamma-glutamyl-gamma-aminobutyrate hydrolase family protein [Lentzea sp. BCCO 10_0856]|uniref:Gamma-glutamyl-gamma-aminobutyrate hydrolase family protein n=1 Tax=Lentzea miocenica TaxID=3095431 RepID=A0ABU4TC90_9PSEU|nr:gamma-glutamyl-gamma-aminobutyrate hydrolase family protein [Lentzea sp. BCCO 10_0856]MDX8035794.1 gamma-glutamyl-gamma-aminobutyrate hydrolase family protein [Lentzea sp. BCCO 10_0856]
MSASKPLIGISTYLERTRFGHWDVEAAVLYRGYLDCVVQAGGNPVMLPPVGTWTAESIAFLDGLVIAGGADIDPAAYGADKHEMTGEPRRDRDDAEFALVDAALKLDLPVLGVCRGMQVLNVALGGTLHQHIEGHNPAPGVFGHTDIEVVGDSRLHDVLGDATTVQCHHHQSLDRVADGLRVTAKAPDGTVEAVELEGARFVVGVQSHPEQDIEDLRLFEALVEVAQQSAVRRNE